MTIEISLWPLSRGFRTLNALKEDTPPESVFVLLQLDKLHCFDELMRKQIDWMGSIKSTIANVAISQEESSLGTSKTTELVPEGTFCQT